ncbi:MAG TPA: signal peptidase I, partial [Terriglobales bacterium]
NAVKVPAGAYYVLGDHRNSSNDSRFWGCLPGGDIFGRAVFAYWPVADLGLVH